jgi:hypothetical protein
VRCLVKVKKNQGMNMVIYVRVPSDLIKLLDKRVSSERRATKGRSVSRADVVRQILYAALEKG